MYLVAMATSRAAALSKTAFNVTRIVTLYVYYRNAKMYLKVWLTKSTGLVWPPKLKRQATPMLYAAFLC